MLILANFAEDAANFCKSTEPIWQLLGIWITIIKVVIPIVLIVLGMLDIGKAVTAGKDDEIKKQAMSFLRRAIAAIIVFFVPTIVGMIMQMVNTTTGENTCGYGLCIGAATGLKANCSATAKK